MKRGNRVTIFEDPYTEKKLECEAKLLKLVQDDGDIQFWEVEIEGAKYLRWIRTSSPANKRVGKPGTFVPIGTG